MASPIKLIVDFPCHSKGTLLTDDGRGNFVTDDGILFLSKEFVDQNPKVAETTEITPDGTTYFFIDDQGIVKEATFDKAAETRKEFGNYFLSNQSASDAVLKLQPIYKDLSLGSK